MSGERILIMDDRRENLFFLANSVLRPEGYEVLTAVDGKQGLEMALAEGPDLIITDLKMPRMSGLEVLAALKKAGVDIPVILTTFYGSEQTAIQAFRLGAKDYIVKPYEVQEMLHAVERALTERRLRRGQESLRQDAESRKHLEARVRSLHSLCSIGRALTSLRQEDEVACVAVDAAVYLTDGESADLFLVSETEGRLQARAVRGASDAKARSVRMAGGDPLVQQVLEQGKALTIGWTYGGGREPGTRLGVPLRSPSPGEPVLGVLSVVSKAGQPITDNDRYHLSILADFAAVAVANTRLVGQMRAQLTERPAVLGLPAASLTSLERWVADLEGVTAEARALISLVKEKNS